MSNAKQAEHNKKTYPWYENPSDTELAIFLDEMRHMLQSFCEISKCDIEKFSVNESVLIEVCIRVDQRKLHYKMYHQGTLINEPKEAALMAYWIARFKPFTYDVGGQHVCGNINELFSLYLIFSIIANYRHRENMKCLLWEPNITRDLLYTVANRSISYDDMALLVDSLAHVGVAA